MTKQEADFIGSMNMCDEISNEAYKKIMCNCEEEESQPRWIPVSERLPEENISVIGTTKFNDIYETELYDDCGEKKWYADGNYDVPIVAWIPLPPLYTESEDKG